MKAKHTTKKPTGVKPVKKVSGPAKGAEMMMAPGKPAMAAMGKPMPPKRKGGAY